MIGKTISHYKILEKLGEGGMGVVYKAQDTKLDRIVALKFLPKHLLCDEEAKKRFVHEAKAASALNHPNITTIYEIDDVEGECFIAMEYVEGISIKELIKEKELSIEGIFKIGIQMADGLSKAHQKGIVHRDIKSDNIMLANEGLVKIMDFGLAKLKGVSKVTKAGTTLGTVSYMSPEQARGKEVDHRTDIWSLGIVLYEMLTGQLPFKGEYEQAVVYSIMNEEPEPLTGLRTGVPMELERIVNKVLTKGPDERYQHIHEMVVDLKTVRKQLETGKAEERPIKTETIKRKPVYFYLGFAILVAFVVLLGIHFFPTYEETIDSIAVLPLQNLSGDSEQEYFSDGMTDALIAELSRISAFERVISRQSVMQYKGSTKSMPDIARELNVDVVLEGTVLLVEDRVRIMAQLIEGKKDRHLWAKKYDRDLKDILVLQSEVAQSIAQEIELKLTPEDQTRLANARSVNPEAYKAYLKGNYNYNKFTQDGFKKAQEYYEQAIREDSLYAPAYVGLAQSFALRASPEGSSSLQPMETYPKVKKVITKALDIDNTLGEAHTTLGFVYLYYDWDWSSAEKEFKLGIMLSPNCARAHGDYSLYLAAVGRLEEAIAEVKRCIELDPLYVVAHSDLGWYFLLSGQYNLATEQFLKTLELDQNFPIAHWNLGILYSESGTYEEAITELKEAILFSGDNPNIKATLAYAYAKAGKKDETLKILDELIVLSKRRYVPSASIADIFIGLGDREQAFEWLNKAYEERDPSLIWLRGPVYNSLRSDPRFLELMKKVGLKE